MLTSAFNVLGNCMKCVDCDTRVSVVPPGALVLLYPRQTKLVFTRVVAALLVSFRRQGFRIFSYLDDWLLVVISQVFLVHHLSLLLQMTRVLIFVITF